MQHFLLKCIHMTTINQSDISGFSLCTCGQTTFLGANDAIVTVAIHQTSDLSVPVTLRGKNIILKSVGHKKGNFTLVLLFALSSHFSAIKNKNAN